MFLVVMHKMICSLKGRGMTYVFKRHLIVAIEVLVKQ